MMSRNPDELRKFLELHASLKARNTKVSSDRSEAVLLHLIIARLKFHISRGITECEGITVTKTA